MSVISDVLANSSVQTTTTKDSLTSAATGGQALGKDAFLQLLVTQLKNQNPLDPQDNSEFVAQLAQFSSLEGITTLNDTVSGLASSYSSSQALLNGTVVVPTSVAAATVKINNSEGKTIRTLELGSQSAGNTSFIWDGKDDAGAVAPAGTYTFGATATIDSKATSLITYLPATVNSVTISQTGGELMLNLAGMGSVALSKVQTIGI
jgi:flagellar basal-body rod modification protein FlgD